LERREFLGGCVALTSAGGLSALSAWADAAPRFYDRAALVDSVGNPLRVRALKNETNYVFQFPFASTPCFLLKLDRPVETSVTLKREDGSTYEWRGGVGPARSIVAFSAICAHKLAYPTRDVSFIRYQRQRSSNSVAQAIHCCAEHSVYDPASGAKVVSGPAPQPLAAIILDYDANGDTLVAVGTVGAEQFDAFFRKYEFRLALEYGEGKARRPVGTRTVVKELAEYCRNTIQC
jgi:arsenite oxidase small subunit